VVIQEEQTMPFKTIDADKDNHVGELMRFSFNVKDELFGAVCPKCNGYVLVLPEQAAMGRAQCFGNIILLAWLKD
jgi:hypothetical protein